MILRILAEAEAEMEAARLYLNQQSTGLGSRFIDELSDIFDAILHRPLTFPQLSSAAAYRRALLPTFRYKIIFEIASGSIFIVAIAHSSRMPDYWFGRNTS